MFNQEHGPKWGILYLILPLAAGLFWLEMKVPWPEAEHRAAQAGVVLLIFGLVELWLRANRLAFLGEDQESQNKNGRQGQERDVLVQDISAPEAWDASWPLAFPYQARRKANGHGHISRYWVSDWSVADSGSPPIQHSGFDSQVDLGASEKEE